MTEQEFIRQVWRPYDKITTAEGVPGKVLGVSFTTKSVRAFISGAPEWVKCELIETHTTGKGVLPQTGQGPIVAACVVLGVAAGIGAVRIGRRRSSR